MRPAASSPALPLLRGRAPILVLSAALFVTFAALVPGFGSTANVSGILLSALPLVLLATGQTFVLISAGIDLSAPAIVGLASVVGGLVMSSDSGVLAAHPLVTPAGIAAMLATGGSGGAIHRRLRRGLP